MSNLERRNFAKQTMKWGGALSLLTALNFPHVVWGASSPLDKLKDNKFLQRDDVSDALKSLYMTYDSTTPYPHKFNETITKGYLVALQFWSSKGLEKEWIEHYVTAMGPILQKIKKWVEKEGPEKGLFGMFERTSCSFQLFERISVKPGERSFPCPFKGKLEDCKKWLGTSTFTIEWKDVCNKSCIPMWSGFAKGIGINITIHPGEECRVRLA